VQTLKLCNDVATEESAGTGDENGFSARSGNFCHCRTTTSVRNNRSNKSLALTRARSEEHTGCDLKTAPHLALTDQARLHADPPSVLVSRLPMIGLSVSRLREVHVSGADSNRARQLTQSTRSGPRMQSALARSRSPSSTYGG